MSCWVSLAIKLRGSVLFSTYPGYLISKVEGHLEIYKHRSFGIGLISGIVYPCGITMDSTQVCLCYHYLCCKNAFHFIIKFFKKKITFAPRYTPNVESFFSVPSTKCHKYLVFIHSYISVIIYTSMFVLTIVNYPLIQDIII